MNERQLIVELVFKPKPKGMKLYPEETQLLLAYIGEILKEVEEAEQATTTEREDISCK